MAVYSVSGQYGTLSASLKSAIVISNAAAAYRRSKIFDINVSQGGAPASTDTNIEFVFGRFTGSAPSGGTAQTPCPADLADAATTMTCQIAPTIEPGTITAQNLFDMFLNQRAPYRWQTYLGSGAELVLPATASIGGTLRTQSAGYTGSAGGTIYFQEQ
jgi:hypothetical protein